MLSDERVPWGRPSYNKRKQRAAGANSHAGTPVHIASSCFVSCGARIKVVVVLDVQPPR